MPIQQPASQLLQTNPILNKWGLPLRVAPTGEMTVQTAPHPRINETFDSGTWDTINRWVITNGGGGVLPSAVVGQATLNSGTTLNGFSKATTLNLPGGANAFKLTEPGFHLFCDRINIENPILATGHRFWGSGTSPASPTIASPITQGMGWEITTGGVFTPVVYQTGTRVAPGVGIQLTDSFPVNGVGDANAHKYYRWFRGDIAFWCIDDPMNIVAYYLTGASGPDVNALPLLYQCISNGGASAVTIVLNGLSVADTADSSSAVLLNNGTLWYDEQRSNMDANSAVVTLTAQGAGTVNSADQLNVNGRGVVLGINTTVDAAGAYTVAIQGKDIVSGQYYTIPGAITGTIAATGFTTLSVYPGIVAAANAAVSWPLPRTWRVQVVVTTGPITATIGSSIIV